MPVFAADIAFEFDTNGVLPSAQGATYFRGPGAGVPDSVVFSTSNGILTQNMAGRGGNYAYYGVNGFDHSLPAVLEWRVKLSPTSGGHTAIELNDNSNGSGPNWGFFLSPTGVSLYPDLGTPIVSLDTSETFHTYQVTVPANSNDFELFIDGVSRFKGVSPISILGDAALVWGDVSSGDPDTFAEWDYVRLRPDLSSATWTELQVTGTAPPHAFGPSTFYDGANNRLIAFFPGSPSLFPYGNEVWVITNANGLGGTAEWIKLLPTGTAPRSNSEQSVVYDAIENRLIVYGGCFANCSPAISDVFVLTNANGLGGAPAWNRSTVSNPQARAYQSAVYDSDSNRMIAFGGNDAFFSTDHNDTRILSNANGIPSPSAWTTLQTTGGLPGIRNNHTAVYDETGRNMVVFGGENYISNWGPYRISDYNDTWMLSDADGSSGTPLWTDMMPIGAPPPGRGYHSAVYDPANDRMIVFGGLQYQQVSQTHVPLGDLWELQNATGAGGAPEWVELAQSGQVPGPRYVHGAAWDEANQRMMVLSGADANGQVAHRLWVLALNDGPPPPANLPPVANAGVSRQVKLGVQTVLDGRGSYDPEGQAITPAWSFLSRPAGSAAQLTGANTLQPSFVPDLAGQYKIRLDVKDPQGASASAMVTITASANGAPVAVIAPVSGSLAVPINKVLDGRGSYDPDGDTITFKWRLVSKPPASKKGALSGVTRPDPTLIMDAAGDYVVELTVLDPKGLNGKAQRTVTGVSGGGGGGNPDPINCTIKSGVKPGTIYTVEWVECNGKRVSPDAYNTSRPGYVMEFLDPVPGVAGVGLAGTNQSVAYWSYQTKSLTGTIEETTTYMANCTRNPLTDAWGNITPRAITGTAKKNQPISPDQEIRDFKIDTMVVTSKLCDLWGGKPCTTVTKTLPLGCSTK